MMNKINIEPLNKEDVTEAAQVLSKAFILTPFSSKVAGGQSEKHRRMLEKGFEGMIWKKPGKVVVAKNNEQIVGVMRMVKWPDCQNSIPRGLELLPALIFPASFEHNQ